VQESNSVVQDAAARTANLTRKPWNPPTACWCRIANTPTPNHQDRLLHAGSICIDHGRCHQCVHRHIEDPGVLATSLGCKIGFASGEASSVDPSHLSFLSLDSPPMDPWPLSINILELFIKAHSLRLCLQRGFGRAIHVSLGHQQERLLPRSP
jgi:hypothetical protein